MIRFAKWMAASAFGIGLAIGMVLNLGLVPLLESRAVAMRFDETCLDVSSIAPEAQPFVDLQCQVHETIFGDGSLCGAAFNFGTTDMTTPGKYSGTDWRGEPVTFEASQVISLDLEEHQPALQEQGVVARTVFGRIHGPAGKMSVSGLSIFPKGITDDGQFILIVLSAITDDQLAQHEEISRIMAGVRVLDVATFKSSPLSSVTSVSRMSASSGDLATLFAADVTTGSGSPVDPACVKNAYDQYEIAMKTAETNFQTCNDAVLESWIVLNLACAGSIGGGPLAMLICVIAALAAMYVAAKACEDYYGTAQRAAHQSLIANLRACGVVILEA